MGSAARKGGGGGGGGGRDATAAGGWEILYGASFRFPEVTDAFFFEIFWKDFLMAFGDGTGAFGTMSLH